MTSKTSKPTTQTISLSKSAIVKLYGQREDPNLWIAVAWPAALEGLNAYTIRIDASKMCVRFPLTLSEPVWVENVPDWVQEDVNNNHVEGRLNWLTDVYANVSTLWLPPQKEMQDRKLNLMTSLENILRSFGVEEEELVKRAKASAKKNSAIITKRLKENAEFEASQGQ